MKIKGFSLFELLITMALFIGLSMMGIASYSYLMQKNEQQTMVDELRTVLQYAKIQAMILGTPVYLEPLDSSINWSNGMALSFLNKKANKMELIHQWQWHHPHWHMDWKGVHSANQIIFSDNPTQAMSNGRFVLVNNQSHEQVVIVLNRLGRINMTK